MLKGILSLTGLICILWIGYGFVHRDNMAATSMRKSYQAHMDAERYAKAHTAAAHLANKGDMDAYFNLAKLYETGQGVVPNVPRAIAYYKLAGLANHPGAQVYLGELYMQGGILPKDEMLAAHWFEKAVFNGRDDALIPLNKLLHPAPTTVATHFLNKAPSTEARSPVGVR